MVENIDDKYYITLNKDDHIRQWVMLFYGSAGTQKTRTAAQFPDPIFLSCERGFYGGLVSAKEFEPKQIVIKSYEQLIGLLSRLEQDAGTHFKTIILDSFTNFQKLIMKSVLKAAQREIARFDDWNLIQERSRMILNRLGDMNCHIIFIATEAFKTDALDRMFGMPNVIGKFAAELPAGVDICLRFSVQTEISPNSGKKTIKNIMQSVPDSIFNSQKDCSGSLEPFMYTPQGEYTFSHLKHLFVENEQKEN